MESDSGTGRMNQPGANLCDRFQNQLFAVFGGILRQLESGELFGEVLGLMNQSWQALWADIKLLALESECDERSLQFGGAAVETSCV